MNDRPLVHASNIIQGLQSPSQKLPRKPFPLFWNNGAIAVEESLQCIYFGERKGEESVYL